MAAYTAIAVYENWRQFYEVFEFFWTSIDSEKTLLLKIAQYNFFSIDRIFWKWSIFHHATLSNSFQPEPYVWTTTSFRLNENCIYRNCRISLTVHNVIFVTKLLITLNRINSQTTYKDGFLLKVSGNLKQKFYLQIS